MCVVAALLDPRGSTALVWAYETGKDFLVEEIFVKKEFSGLDVI